MASKHERSATDTAEHETRQKQVQQLEIRTREKVGKKLFFVLLIYLLSVAVNQINASIHVQIQRHVTTST